MRGRTRATDPPHAASLQSFRGLSPGRYIKHIVIVVQENRTFDNLFDGFSGADTQTWGYLHDGTRVNLQPISWKFTDMTHNFGTAVMDWDNGKMDKFDLNATYTGPVGTLAYSYLQRSLVAPYWKMAQQYVLADHMFPTMFGEVLPVTSR